MLLLFCWSGTAQSVRRNEIRPRRNFNPPRTYYNDITGLIVQYIYCTLFDVQRPHLITLSEFVYSPSHCKITHPNSIILPIILIILVHMFQPLCIRTYIYVIYTLLLCMTLYYIYCIYNHAIQCHYYLPGIKGHFIIQCISPWEPIYSWRSYYLYMYLDILPQSLTI